MKKLYLGSDKRLCGVCDGVAKFLNLDPVLIRTVVICIAIMTAIIPTLVVYVATALVLPKAPDGYVEVEGVYKKISKAEDKRLFGVCGGIANYFGIDPTIVRLIFVLFTFWIGGGIVSYIVCAMMFPEYDPYDNQTV